MTPTQQLTDLEQARQCFDSSRKRVFDATAGLTEAQWKFKPAPDRWSIAENLEHMVVVHERVLSRLQEQLPQAPAPAPGRDNRAIDALILDKIPERSTKAQSPIQPTGAWTLPFALDRFSEDYGRLLEIVEFTPGLRDHVLDSPPLKFLTNGQYDTMDGYQWAITTALHDERHVRQIEEVKADSGFPA